jgi:hypothetical protein
VLAVDALSWLDTMKKSAQSPSAVAYGEDESSPGKKRHRQLTSRLHGGKGEGYQKILGRGPVQ